MRFYVASKFENAEQARKVMEALHNAGHVISLDWTKHTVDGLSGQELVDALTHYAELDLQGIARSDALVLLPVSADRTRSGAHLVEMGYALGLGKMVFVLGGRPGAPTEHPIFFFHPAVQHFDTVEALIAFADWAAQPFGVKAGA